MAFETFMKASGVSGESKDESHAGWIELLAVGWGVKKTPRATPGETARMIAEDFVVTKALDTSSGLLVKALCENKLLGDVTIEFCRSDGQSKMKFMEWKFTNCHVTNYRMDSREASDVRETLPVEVFSFNYEKFKTTYVQQKRSDGTGGGSVMAGWDLKTNSPA